MLASAPGLGPTPMTSPTRSGTGAAPAPDPTPPASSALLSTSTTGIARAFTASRLRLQAPLHFSRCVDLAPERPWGQRHAATTLARFGLLCVVAAGQAEEREERLGIEEERE